MGEVMSSGTAGGREPHLLASSVIDCGTSGKLTSWYTFEFVEEVQVCHNVGIIGLHICNQARTCPRSTSSPSDAKCSGVRISSFT